MIKISRIPLSLDSAVKSDLELDQVSASFGEQETKVRIQNPLGTRVIRKLMGRKQSMSE